MTPDLPEDHEPPAVDGELAMQPVADEPSATEPSEPPAVLPPRRRLVREHAETLLVAILVVLFVSTFITQNAVIPTASMEDTLLVGDYLLVNKVIFAPADAEAPATFLGQRELRHGDIVVFKFPSEPKVDYIKRLVGLPGDMIEIRDKRVFRNGDELEEPLARHKTAIVHPRGTPDGLRDNYGPVTVPPGHLFVMGDNRDYSADSREWGFLPRDHVTGRAFMIFWSKVQRPGAWKATGADRIRRVIEAFGNFYSTTRWGRILTVVR